MITNREDVTLRFTAEQSAQLERVTGIALSQIVVKRLFLKVAAAIALRTQSQTLLISDSQDALQLMREAGIAAVESLHFLFSMKLDAAQQQQLQQITGQNFECVAILPDDYQISYSETWAETPFPLDIGQSLTIANSGQILAPSAGQRQIVLVQANDYSGFGTGAHPTTRMCLELIEENLQAGQRVLEVGTGSGILAIACAKLGAAKVIASDVDEASVRAARKNVRINELDENIHVELGTLVDEGAQVELQSYDWIIGNLFPRVVKPLFPEFSRRLKRGGHVIVSGVTTERESDVALAWQRAGFAVQQRRQRNNWVALVLEFS